MAKVEGLNLRGSRWYVRIIIPDDLREAYGKDRVNVALGTSERREAVELATIKRAEWLADFAARRSEAKPSPVDIVTPELARVLAERVRASVLAEDDRVRSDLPLLAEMVHMRRELQKRRDNRLRIPQWDLPEPRLDDLTGATEEELRELAELNAVLEGRASVDLARVNLAAVLPLATAEAAKLGVSFDPRTPGAREALLQCLRAYRTAHRELTMRDAGEPVETPEAPALPAALPSGSAAPERSLRAVYERWQKSGASPKSADSIAAYGRALAQFEAWRPGVTLASINRDMGDQYAGWLRENCGTPKTARDRLTALKSLLKYAAETLEWIPKQPWRGLDIKSTTTHKRRPWSDAELSTLFGSPLHQRYELPDAKNAGRDAAYWIPLLGLYSGSRLGELCQLRAEDVQTVDGVPVLVLTDEGEGQSIKSAAGHRSVPIHSDLIRLGFLRYAEAIRATGAASLWPALPLRGGKPSDYFGRWFLQLRKDLGLKDPNLDFHCFRHTVRPKMRRGGASETTMDKVTGHKSRGSIGTVVYDHWTLQEIRAAVEAIQYPELKLPAVSPHANRERP